MPRLNHRCSSDTRIHKKWNILKTDEGNWKFDTSKEAEYPSQLAKAIALSLLEKTVGLNKFNLNEDLNDHAIKVATFNQPRKGRSTLLLSEFKHKVSIQCVSAEPPAIVSPDALPPFQGIPVGSKRIDLHPVQVQDGEEGKMKVTYGVYF